MSDIYKVIVKKDNDGELYIDLPDELMKSLDWKIGDELVWEETDVLDDEGNYLEDNNE
jgi:3-dehydroquinate synthase class II